MTQPIPGKLTKITKGGDATLVEVTIEGAKPLVWKVPNMMFDRLGYSLGSEVRVTVDTHGNLQGVQPPLPSSTPRPFKI